MNLSILRQQYPNLRDYTDDEIMQVVAGSAGVQPDTQQYKSLQSQLLGYDRTAQQVAKDTGIGVAQGVLGLGQTAATLGAALIPGVRAYDNPITNAFDRWGKGLDQYKSSGLRAQEAGAEVARDIAVRQSAAEGDGYAGQFLAGAGAQAGQYLRNPGMLAQDIAGSLPSLVAGGGIGRAAQVGARALGAGANAAARVGVAGAVGGTSTLQGGDVANDTYDRMRQAGAGYDAAAGGATEAGIKGGLASAGISLLPGGAAIERSMIRGAAGTTAGRMGAAVRGAAGEFVGEGTEEAYGRYAGNQSVQQVNPNQNLMDGVGSAFVQGGVAAGPLGGIAGARASGRPAIRPTPTPTGELDLLGSAPQAPAAPGPNYDTPAYERRGLDPLNERSSPWPGGAPAAPRTYADLIDEAPQPTYADLVAQSNRPLPVDPYTAWTNEANAATAAAQQRAAEQAAQEAAQQEQARQGGQQMLQQQADAYLAERAAQNQNPQQPQRIIAAGQGPGAIAIPVDAPGPIEQRPAAIGAAVEQARAQNQQAFANGAEPNRGQVLAALQQANTALGARVVNKDGSVSKARSTEQLRGVLESKTPLATMREMYQDGKAPRDELLDVWHQQITGQSISDWKAAQAPELNSAGFVPEPLPQVRAQVQAVREGRKGVAVMGEQEARVVNTTGLARGVAVGPDGARAVVVGRDQGAVNQAVARAKEVGLKVAMGEALGVANPTLTTNASPDAAMLQQVDNQSGQVLAEEVVTPSDVQNVKQVPGTTARIVPVDKALADRKTKKTPSTRRQSTDKLIQTVENAKDETQYNDALYEIYRRAAEDTDEGKSFNYLDKNPPTATEQQMLRERFDAEKGQARGKKFGAVKEVRAGNPDVGRSRALPDSAKTGSATSAARWLVRNAQSKPDREIARRITPYLEGTRLVWVGEDTVVPEEVGAHLAGQARGVTALDGDTGEVTIYLRSDGAVEDVLAHELIHAATIAALEDPANAAISNDLESLRQDIVRAISANGIGAAGTDRKAMADFFSRAVADPHELLAYAYSSPTLREFLQGIGADGRPLPRRETTYRQVRPTAWQRLINNLRALFKLPPSYHERFEAVVSAGPAFEGDNVYAELDRMLSQLLDGPGNGPRGGEPVVRANVTETPETAPISRGAKEVAAYAKALAKGEEISPTLLDFLTVRQIGDQYGGKLPALREWAGALMERGAAASKIAAEADRVALQWQQAVRDKTERKALADVLLRASNAELQLDNTSSEYLNSLSAEDRAEHTALRQKLAALSPEAQAVRKQALDVLRRQWDYTRKALETFINQTVADPGMRAARLQDLQTAMGRNRGDYFPMSRFGDRVVVARGAAADGRDIVTFHESAASLEAEVRKLKAAGVRPSNIVVTQKGEYDPNNSGSTGFVRELHSLIDNTVEDADTNRQMHEALQQLYLKSLPELSGAKHMIRRESVEGYSTDALRVFADAVTRGSRYASHLEFAPRIQAALEAAQAQSRSADRRTAAVVIGRKDGSPTVVRVVATGTDRLAETQALAMDGYATEYFNTVPDSVAERLAAAVPELTAEQVAGYQQKLEQLVAKEAGEVEDLRAAKQLHNHMVKLQKADTNEPGKIVELAGQLGYAWYLGFSPAFWAMNTLQNPMIGIPHLGGKYGVGRASAEWVRAMKWFSGVRIGKLLADRNTPFSVDWLREGIKEGGVTGLSKNELDMLQTLEDRQVLDFTQAADLSRIGAATDGPWYKAMRLAAAGAHHTEVFNRVSFALAAYRLALKSDPSVTHEDAVRRAENDMAAVHFDYSSANKPYAMGKGNQYARLIFMFQQYRQHMLYWWANTIKDAVKGESKEVQAAARKSALLMGATNLMFAGTMGLPFIGAIGLLANLLGGADDGEEPFDFERWMLEAAVGLTGSQKAGEVLSKGIFAAMGLDISKRIGQADLLPLLNEGSARYERDADDKARAYLFDLLGPMGSIALGAARATDAFASGDTLKALASMTPKAAADIVRAYQLQMEGMKDKRGNYIATAEAFDGADVAIQALGVTPSAVANVRQARSAVADVQYGFKNQQQRLTGNFVESWQRGDTKGMTEALADIQKYNANIANGKYRDPKLLINQQQLANAVRDRQQRAMLLALTGGLADTRQQLLIATRMSGLYDMTGGVLNGQVGNGLPSLPGLPGLN